MRKIKFRAWDGERMFRNIQEAYDTLEEDSNNNVSCFYDYLTDDDYSVMQSTGLKDKNGKEIYEGDIVQVSYRGGEHLKAVGWVEYLKPSFIVRTKQDTKKPYFLCLYAHNYSPLFNWAESEVIGNIYENPDLLQ
jgi:uncharacterized phage protein (TIGR01671 family)